MIPGGRVQVQPEPVRTLLSGWPDAGLLRLAGARRRTTLPFLPMAERVQAVRSGLGASSQDVVTPEPAAVAYFARVARGSYETVYVW